MVTVNIVETLVSTPECFQIFRKPRTALLCKSEETIKIERNPNISELKTRDIGSVDSPTIPFFLQSTTAEIHTDGTRRLRLAPAYTSSCCDIQWNRGHEPRGSPKTVFRLPASRTASLVTAPWRTRFSVEAGPRPSRGTLCVVGLGKRTGTQGPARLRASPTRTVFLRACRTVFSAIQPVEDVDTWNRRDEWSTVNLGTRDVCRRVWESSIDSGSPGRILDCAGVPAICPTVFTDRARRFSCEIGIVRRSSRLCSEKSRDANRQWIDGAWRVYRRCIDSV